MFDFSWSEIMVIGAVALVLIGPKDMPVAIRATTRVLKKMRRMAGEFQHHVDEMMREAELGEVSSTLRDFRGMNLKNAINRVVDPDGSVGRAFHDPFESHPVPQTRSASWPPAPAQPISMPPPGEPPPAFIPPACAPLPLTAAPVAPVSAAPAFVPPATDPPPEHGGA